MPPPNSPPHPRAPRLSLAAPIPMNPRNSAPFSMPSSRQTTGPGALPSAPGEHAAPRCVIAPHIDFNRGGATYAHAYRPLAQGRAPKTVLIFGVAHAGGPDPFMLINKGYDTPLGALAVDEEAVRLLADACSWEPFASEIAHRSEHSIEFQAVMLAHVLGPGVRIVPVLCGSFDDESGGYPQDPSVIEPVARFLDACNALVRSADGAMCVVAGADLAHVGFRFGDDFEIDDAVIERIERRDKEDLAKAAALDPVGWYTSVMKDANARRVCGMNCIYAALKSVEGTAAPGEILHYGYAPDPSGGMVSFAGLVFPEGH